MKAPGADTATAALDTARSSGGRPTAASGTPPLIEIRARTGWVSIGFRELWEYRDLFSFLVRRDVKARYAQSILGVGWAIIPPFFSMVVFSIIFGKLARIASDGVPFPIFSYTALVPWTYFSSALTAATGSLVTRPAMLTKVYFPRLIMPLASISARLLDFGVSLLVLFGMMAWFRIMPSIWVLILPLLVLLLLLAVSGLGLWFTAIAVQYRDVNYAMGFLVHLLMYAAPVVYPASLVPDRYRLLYAVNPMVGVIEGFRSALLSTRPMPWDLIAVGFASALLVAASGALYFRRTERVFADVV